MKLKKCTDCSGPCFARSKSGGCLILTDPSREDLCPFRKPDRHMTKGRKYPDGRYVRLDRHGLPVVDKAGV